MLKKILKSVREFKRASLLTPLCTGLEVVMEVIIPILMAQLIDKGISVGNMGMVAKMGALVALCACASMFFGIMGARFAAEAMAGFSRNLRHDMFHKVQTFSFANIDRFSTSSIITRMTTDVMHTQNAYTSILRIACRGPLMLIFSLVMSFSINAKLSLIFLGALPILAVGLLMISKHVHPVFRKMFTKMDDMNRVVQENLHGIRVVKSFVREDHENEKFEDAAHNVYALNLKAERLLALNNPIMSFCMDASMLLIGWVGAKMIINGVDGMTTGYLTSLISYAMQSLGSLMMLSMVYVMLTMAVPAANRIVEVLDEQPDIADPAKPIMSVPDGSVDMENVGFSYSGDPERLCLTGIDLHIRSGETVGILGGTGSSKSSLIQLIPRLYDATLGTVKVGGHDVKEYDLTALRDSVSVVLQKNELFAGSIYQNLRWGNEKATDAEVEHAAQLAQADEFIRAMPQGYETFIEQGGTNVSGGQKQRLCIARALLKKPKILILDDSTSAVDTKTDALIRKAFREEIPNTTKFIIAQRVASVEDADHIIVMDNGKINGFGTHEELLAGNAIYREVWESQKKGGDEE